MKIWEWFDRWINPQDYKEPETLWELIDKVYEGLDKPSRRYLKEGYPVHYRFGINIRYDYHLWDRKSPVVQWCIANLGLDHADDISGLVISGLRLKAKEELLNLDDEIARYKAHWKQFGVDPAKTCEKQD